MTITATPIDPRIIRFSVRNSHARLGLTVNLETQLHLLGLRDAPRYHLRQPAVPDGGWQVTQDVSGGLLSSETPQSPWPSAAERSGLASMLPNGDYLAVYSKGAPHETDWFLHGNQFSAITADRQVLINDQDLFIGLIGATPGEPPARSGPLLGLSLLGYDGSSLMQGVLFFSMHDAGPPSDGLHLVIPVTGELVFDNFVLFGGDPDLLERWASHGALDAARRLAAL